MAGPFVAHREVLAERAPRSTRCRPTPGWRFSGRWWAKPVPLAERPWAVTEDRRQARAHVGRRRRGGDPRRRRGPSIRGPRPPTPTTSSMGVEVRTLARPGELLCRFATVNDVHFGEEVCGILEGYDDGPRSPPSRATTRIPRIMNRAAIAEIAAIDPEAVVVKGDLTTDGHRRGVRGVPGPVLRGRVRRAPPPRAGQPRRLPRETFAAGAPVESGAARRSWRCSTPSSLPRPPGGSPASSSSGSTTWPPADRPCWCWATITSGHPTPVTVRTYFGINPDDSERLVELIAVARDRRVLRRPHPPEPGPPAPRAPSRGSRWRA